MDEQSQEQIPRMQRMRERPVTAVATHQAQWIWYQAGRRQQNPATGPLQTQSPLRAPHQLSHSDRDDRHVVSQPATTTTIKASTIVCILITCSEATLTDLCSALSDL